MKSLIEIRGLTYTIPYSHNILEDVDLDVRPGEFIGILGHNGTGKTTLLDVILGIRKASHGTIKILNEDPHSANRKNKNKIVFLSQDISIKGNLSISEFLSFHSHFFPDYSKKDEEVLLNVFSLYPDQKIGSLSTGQQKKVQVVAGLSSRPELILIDEITAVMDPETRDVFFKELLKVKNNHDASILLATNIAEDLIGRADKVLFIRDRKSSQHRPEEIMELFNLRQTA